MKKDKNSLKQKIVIAIACLVIVACTISMTTMAWFTDTMQGTTNLTFGKIKLSDDFTEYTFNTPETPAVASRKINNGAWAIVLDETSNDAFIRLIAKYGVPVSYTLTKDSTYLPNKAYYKVVSTNYVKMVEGSGEDYEVGHDITSPNSTVYECNYSLDYARFIDEQENNITLGKIRSEYFTTQYYDVNHVNVGSTFVKGIKYYAYVGDEFRALIGSTTYDANTDYYYGMLYDDFDPDNNTQTYNDVYVAYKYVSGEEAAYKIVPNDIALTEDTTYQSGKTYYDSLGIQLSSFDVGDPIASNTVYEATSTYFKLVEATGTEGFIDIGNNSQVGDISDGTNMYTIYNAYIDWLIENVALPETPATSEALGHYFIDIDDTDPEHLAGDVDTQKTYAFIKSAVTDQGTAEYYLASDLAGTALNAERTDSEVDEDGNAITNRFVFAEDGAIKIKDSADQITLKSATLTAIANSTDLAAAVGANGDPTKVLVKHNITEGTGNEQVLLRTYYTLYDDEEYAENTFYTYTGDVTVINGHVYFLTAATNGTLLTLKYAQKDLGLGLSVDIQAIQTILSRKATSDDVTAGLATAAGDKLTIAIMTAADCTTLSIDAANAGKLGAYKNGTIQRIATIADIAPYFKAQFDRPAN